MKLIRWLLYKFGRMNDCQYLHPNETHHRWEKRQIDLMIGCIDNDLS